MVQCRIDGGENERDGELFRRIEEALVSKRRGELRNNMSLHEAGQTSSVSCVGVSGVQKSSRSRRRGD
jgi:hypothetical protein